MTEADKEYLKRFGEHIRAIRKAKGVTATDLARWCDTQIRSISRLENGGVNPSLLFLTKVSEALDLTLNDLFKNFPGKE
jgi:putative transcriptional regulator